MVSGMRCGLAPARSQSRSACKLSSTLPARRAGDHRRWASLVLLRVRNQRAQLGLDSRPVLLAQHARDPAVEKYREGQVQPPPPIAGGRLGGVGGEQVHYFTLRYESVQCGTTPPIRTSFF